MDISKNIFFFFMSCLFIQLLDAQETSIFGVVTDQKGHAIEGLSIEHKNKGTISDFNGNYHIIIPRQKEVLVVYSHLGFKNQIHKLNIGQADSLEFNLIFEPQVNVMPEVELVDEALRNQNITTIDAKNLNIVTGPLGGVEGLISTLSGVSTKNEMSSQYSVRGGNFDENLVYVNGFEIYRPFLVRSGEQEGLSFINSDMVQDISFSAGGFASRYGDKLSSVLNIKYKDPKSWKNHLTLSFLGLSATVEGISRSKRLSHVTSFRQKTNQFLLNSLDTESSYRPNFNDFQSLNTYHINSQLTLSILAHYSSNTYQSIPQSRQSDFGTIDQPLRLNIYFDGQEKDAYQNGMGAVRIDYQHHDSLKMSLASSLFQTREEEYFDVEAQYFLGQLDNSLSSDNFGEIVANRGIGGFFRHARNDLFAQVFNLQYRSKWARTHSILEWGAKYQSEEINDQLKEWQLIDSSGFSMPQGLDTILEIFEFVEANNSLTSHRLTSYIQQNGKINLAQIKFKYNIGLRTHYWSMNNEFFISPRVGLSFFPAWKKDVLIKFSIGSYNQSPFYRELRDKEGNLFTNLKSQKSVHFVATADYNFSSWGRPFKFVTALYYKSLKDIIPYEIDNLRIRYLPEQSANGFTTGLDIRVNGEFVPGVESWASFSLMKSQEDIAGDGYGFIPRPTDQRLSFSLFFQDYLPKSPSYKMNLKLHYSTGLPVGAINSERFEQIIRIPAYRRVDIGFTKVIKQGDQGSKWKYFKNFDSVWLSAEVFNLLGIRNTVSYLWVSDVVQNQYAVPNYLTSRLLNLKLQMKF